MTEQNIAAQAEEQLSPEQAFERLDEILEILTDKQTGLDESFAAYAEGTKLLKQANDHLDRIEKKMLILEEGGTLHEF